MEDISFTHLIHTNYKPNPYINKLPLFYSKILNDWIDIKKISITPSKEIQNQMLWLNKSRYFENKPFLLKNWHSKGATYIINLLNEDGE